MTIKKTTSLCLGLGIVVSPWLIHNFMLTGYISFHTLAGWHFLTLYAAPAIALDRQSSVKSARNDLLSEFRLLQRQREKQGRSLMAIERCILAENLAKYHLKKHWPTALKLGIKNIFKTMLGLYASELVRIKGKPATTNENRTILRRVKRYLWQATNSWPLRLIIWFEILFLFIVILGLLLQGIAITRFVLAKTVAPILCVGLKTSPFIALFIFITLADGYARLRLPIEPMLIILLFQAWHHLLLDKRNAICL